MSDKIDFDFSVPYSIVECKARLFSAKNEMPYFEKVYFDIFPQGDNWIAFKGKKYLSNRMLIQIEGCLRSTALYSTSIKGTISSNKPSIKVTAPIIILFAVAIVASGIYVFLAPLLFAAINLAYYEHYIAQEQQVMADKLKLVFLD